MYARICACLVACALVLTGLASAQERFGALTGRVTDQQGSAVPGVTVVTTNTQTGEVRTFVTDANGQYQSSGPISAWRLADRSNSTPLCGSVS